MKLDPTVMRTMNSQDFRVMEAVEKGMKDHNLVPPKLVAAYANLRHGGAHKIISSLLRDKLLSHETKKHGFDGYRLTNAGYDILALHNLKSRGFVAALGHKIGTGKESDIYIAVNPSGEQVVLKFHRLGRTSFRNVKKKRDYFGKAAQQAHSWLFLSRLSALKEYAFMKALFDVDYPTPTPIAHNRHIVVMGLVRGVPLYQIYPKQLSVEQAADIYEQAIRLAARLAGHGLVHCDLNEFNLMVDLSGIQSLATTGDDPYVRHSGQSVAGEKSLGALSKPAWEQSLEEGDRIKESLPLPAAFLDNGEPKPVVTLIDFPQMISTKHPNAQELYERDMACLKRFFELKLLCTIPEDAALGHLWNDVVVMQSNDAGLPGLSEDRLDEELRASGFSDKFKSGLELYYFDSGAHPESAVVNETVPEEDFDDNDDDDDDDDDDDYHHHDHHEKGEEENNDASLQSKDNEEPAIGDVAEHIEEPYPSDRVGDNENTKDVGIELEDGESLVSGMVVVEDANSVLPLMDRERIEMEARNRVRKQIEEQKRKSRKSGAFRAKNSNKSYVKGKRILKDEF
ncbi:hypothetical protein ACA910_009230 [Epithemia clementina (nom. ined.)]